MFDNMIVVGVSNKKSSKANETGIRFSFPSSKDPLQEKVC